MLYLTKTITGNTRVRYHDNRKSLFGCGGGREHAHLHASSECNERWVAAIARKPQILRLRVNRSRCIRRLMRRKLKEKEGEQQQRQCLLAMEHGSTAQAKV